MTPEQLAVLGGTVTSSYGESVVDLDRAGWLAAVTAARDVLGYELFDLLTAVDLQDEGFQVVLRLWSVATREGLRLRTRCPHAEPVVPSVVAVFRGAGWHERQVAELFGVVFAGHPAPGPLLLAGDVVGHPLRKDFVLTSRTETPWPGAKEPGESDADLAGAAVTAGRRRKNLPLGVPR